MRVGFQVFWRDEELDLLRQSGVYEQTLHRKLLLKSQFETIQPVMIPTAENEKFQSCGIINQLQINFDLFLSFTKFAMWLFVGCREVPRII